MLTQNRTRSFGIVLILAMLLAAMPVWAEDPVPTDKYDSLSLATEAPSLLPKTGLSRAHQADAARWQGLANAYLSSAPAMQPTTQLTRAQQADVARWQGLASAYLSSAPAMLPATGLTRAQQADAARWRGGVLRP